MSSCKIAQSSLTYAMKVKRLLTLHGIAGEVVRLEPWETKKGCGFGVRFDCEHYRKVTSLLQEAGIVYSETVRGGLL